MKPAELFALSVITNNYLQRWTFAWSLSFYTVFLVRERRRSAWRGHWAHQPRMTASTNRTISDYTDADAKFANRDLCVIRNWFTRVSAACSASRLIYYSISSWDLLPIQFFLNRICPILLSVYLLQLPSFLLLSVALLRVFSRRKKNRIQCAWYQ